MNNSEKDDVIAALKTEIETMKAIISMMPGHVYWKNADGKYMGCNNNLAKVLKLSSPDDIIGKTDADLTGYELAQNTTEIDLKVLSNQKELRIEETGFDENGQLAFYLTQKSPLINKSGQIRGVLGISLDITARKQTEDRLKIEKQKAEAANRAKSQFLALVSHELRTPLTSLLGFASFLEQEKLSDEEKKLYLQHITNSGSYLFSLINNILDYNKLESNNYELINTPFNLKKLMQETINVLSGAAKLKKLALTLDYDENAPEYFVSDSRVFKQVLINLIGNAIKFTEKGYVTLKVRCINQNKNDAQLFIAVEDSGIGIPHHEQRSVFKRFHQLGNVYTRNASLAGTGLGLAIVRKLTKLIGCKVELNSEPGRGSTFYFTAKLQTTIPTEIELSSPQRVHTLAGGQPRILLVEDDALIQLVHKKMLEELGCLVHIAEHASKALENLTNNYDMLFVDIGLPDMSGFELIRIIREKYFNLQQIPIIALTGYSEEEEHQQCIYVGANEVAVKPIIKASLGKILERYIQKSVLLP